MKVLGKSVIQKVRGKKEGQSKNLFGECPWRQRWIDMKAGGLVANWLAVICLGTRHHREGELKKRRERTGGDPTGPAAA